MSNNELAKKHQEEAEYGRQSPTYERRSRTTSSGSSQSERRARRGQYPEVVSEFGGDTGTVGASSRSHYPSRATAGGSVDETVGAGTTVAPGYTVFGGTKAEQTARRQALQESGTSSQAPRTHTPPAAGTVRETPTSAPRSTSDNHEQIIEMANDLTDVQRRLLDELTDINGQDSYDALTAGIGKLKKDEYLRLPNNIRWVEVPARDVGKPDAHRYLTTQNWADIYVMNKSVAPDGVDAIVFGFLRLEAVKAGWYTDQREVTIANVPTDSMVTMLTDFATIRDRLSTIKTAAFVVPLVAEHTFRTMGHHYLTSDSATYAGRYADTLRSSLLPEVATLLPPAVLYHTALHWVSPRRARSVVVAQAGTPTIPDAISIRMNAAPAGTAILTTTVAVIDAMDAVALGDGFQRYGGFDLKLMRDVTVVIRSDPTRYHKSYFAYGVPALDAGESARLEAAKAEAAKFAPYAQAFINTLLRDAALGRARALQKHADGNPVQMRRAQTFFRAFAGKQVKSVAELFQAEISSAEAL